MEDDTIMDQIAKTLYDADVLLARVTVRGDDAIALVNARQRLRVAYDALKQQMDEPEVTDSDGR